MAHDTHFLRRLRRIPPERGALALQLYRSAELLRFVLERAGLRGQARVALALDEGPAPPLLVVTAEGAFVTCLAKHMESGEVPVLGFVQLQELIAQYAQICSLLEQRRALASPPLLESILCDGARLGWAEMNAARAVVSLLWPEFLARLFECAELLEQRRALPSPSAADADAEALSRDEWNELWAIGLLTPLVFENVDASREWTSALALDHPLVPSTFSAPTRFLPSALLGIWASARSGPKLLSALKAQLRGAWRRHAICDAMAAWTAVGLRHAKLRSRVRSELASFDLAGVLAPWRAFTARLRTHFLGALDDPDAALRQALQLALALSEGDDSPTAPCSAGPAPMGPRERLALQAAARTPLALDEQGAWAFAVLVPWAARARLDDFFPGQQVRGDGRASATIERSIALQWNPLWARDFAEARRRFEEEQQAEDRVDCGCGSAQRFLACCGKLWA